MKKKNIWMFCALAGFANISHALPFDVTPVGTLPTSVIQGNPVLAAYTVRNNTTRQLNNVYVHVPPHVTVVRTGCGSTFNIAPGANCTLNLNITGAVSATDPDTNNHLYICLPGGKNCSGTLSPLNVTNVTPPMFTYIGTDANIGGIYSCKVSADVGSFESCSIVPGNDSAGNNVLRNPQWMAFSISGLIAYISDVGVSPDVIWRCDLNTTTGALTGCRDSGATGISDPTAMAFNSDGTRLYITDSTANRVYICTANLLTGDLSGCTDSGGGSAFQAPKGIALNPANTFAYIANSSGGNLTSCAVNANTGLFSGCIVQGSLTAPHGIVITPSGTQMYITDESANRVKLCSVSTTTGTVSGCVNTATGYTFNAPIGIALSYNRSQPAQVYIANNGNGNVAICNYCGVNCTAGQDPGELTCSTSPKATGLTNIIGVTLGVGLT